MPRLTPWDIEKSGRPDFAGVSPLELEETAWRLREAALFFDMDGNLVNSSRPPDVDAPRSRQWRKKPVAPDGVGNEAASSPEGAKPIVPGLAGERWLRRLSRLSLALRCLARLTRKAVALAGYLLPYSRKSI